MSSILIEFAYPNSSPNSLRGKTGLGTFTPRSKGDRERRASFKIYPHAFQAWVLADRNPPPLFQSKKRGAQKRESSLTDENRSRQQNKVRRHIHISETPAGRLKPSLARTHEFRTTCSLMGLRWWKGKGRGEGKGDRVKRTLIYVRVTHSHRPVEQTVKSIPF